MKQPVWMSQKALFGAHGAQLLIAGRRKWPVCRATMRIETQIRTTGKKLIFLSKM